MLDLTRSANGTPVIGIAGWKNSGKTTLVERLIETLVRRGYRVSSVKHAHHAFQIDDGATDSARHRRAGASQTAIVGATRTAIITELKDAIEPSLDVVLAALAPCDLIVVEGYKRVAITKLEVRSAGAKQQDELSAADNTVIAIVLDTLPVASAHVPVFLRDDIEGLADFLVTAGQLRPMSGRSE